MSKNKTKFVCQECGYEASGWLGKCPACNRWNTFVEEIGVKNRDKGWNTENIKPVNINDVTTVDEERYRTGLSELDRVLGGGIVKGSLVLVGGDPGIGKSTLLLQICELLATESRILYISGEESIRQIKMRADRLGVKNEKLMIASATAFSVVEKLVEEVKPCLLIIDSIQTMYNEELSSAPGSVSQVRNVTAALMKIAKVEGISVIIVGHVTKEGTIAGPKVLEHMVDAVLYFEGERHLSYRILRSVKNRFGSTNEIGIFEMRDTGLVEIANPSEVMLSGRPEGVPGSAVVASLEGTRPMLIEVQALVCETGFGMPRRLATGVDYNRITMLMAILEKRIGLQLYNFDAYVNVIGGLKIEEPACDLGLVAAIASSFKNIPIDPGTVFIGETGLTGEIRAVSQIDKRVMEAARIGFKKCLVPSGNINAVKQLKTLNSIEIKAVRDLREAFEVIF